jgi:hypothetical protein
MTAIRSHPTVYRGTNFRSRLEAQWAAFFDLIRWSWVYEPFDTDNWIPDFLIQGEAPFLVEVGPCISRVDYVDKATKALAYPDHPTLVVGVFPLVSWADAPVPGMLANESTGYLDIAYWMTCPAGLAIFQDKIDLPCGHPWSGDHYHVGVDWLNTIEQLWRRASNEVQWKASQPRSIGDLLRGRS